MYDIDLKNVKKGYGFWGLFLGIGILFLIIIGGILIGMFVYKNSLDSNVQSESYEVNSFIDDDSGATRYRATYYFFVDGEKYACSSNVTYSSSPNIDNEIIYYNSKNPTKCTPDGDSGIGYFVLIFLILPIIFIILGAVKVSKIKKRVKLIEQLNTRGKLVKNLPYRLESTGMAVNDVQVMRPVVDYVLPSGSMVTLYGDPRLDMKESDDDHLVDLIVDEANPDNYFIDFEINRLAGNSEKDYYNKDNS